MLHERRQTRNIPGCTVPFLENSRKGNVICSDRKQRGGGLGWRVAAVEAGGRGQIIEGPEEEASGWNRYVHDLEGGGGFPCIQREMGSEPPAPGSLHPLSAPEGEDHTDSFSSPQAHPLSTLAAVAKALTAHIPSA